MPITHHTIIGIWKSPIKRQEFSYARACKYTGLGTICECCNVLDENFWPLLRNIIEHSLSCSDFPWIVFNCL